MNHKNVESANVFEQISQSCRDFCKQIFQGRLPRIEKYLSPISKDRQENLFSNLLKEFRRLSEVNHPNRLVMQTFEVVGSQWYFTMELIKVMTH